MNKADNKTIIKKVLKYIGHYKILLALSLIMAGISAVLSLYLPILLGRCIDKIVCKGQVDFDGLEATIMKMLVIIGVASVCQWMMNALNNRITFGVVKDMRVEAFDRIQKMPLSYIDSNSTGDVVSRVIADVDQFADGLLLGFSQLFTGLITIFGTLAFMIMIDVRIALLVVLITPLSLFVASFIAKKTHNMFVEQARVRGRQTAFIDEMLGNEKVVKAFSREDEAIEEFENINEELRQCSLKAVFFSSTTNPSTRFINGIVYTSVALAGGMYAIKGGITVGQLTSFLSYANQYTKPFNEISGVITELQNALACAGRVIALIEADTESVDSIDATDADVKGGMEFENVAFAYQKDKPLIENFNLKVRNGERVAIVGPTGCGKTTLINLIMRFYDVDGGSVKLSGTDIRDIKRHSLRTSYGMVLQETWLRSGTIRENIAMGKPDATLEEIIEAAKKSHAHSFIKRLPDGYDTFIGDDGGMLSQGQKQLICITRVMLCLPPMLILDEATSSIDTRTEIRIQKAFLAMMEGRTSFIVAHRLSTIKEADTIIVMRDGHIIEQGNHSSLLEQRGFYSQLYNSQFAVS